MIFDVMVREGFNHRNKQMVNTYRYHDSQLNNSLRKMQELGCFIIGVIPLFRSKEDKQGELKDLNGQFVRNIFDVPENDELYDPDFVDWNF